MRLPISGGGSEKASPGAGEGFLADVWSILEGFPAGATPRGFGMRQVEREQAPPAPGAAAQWRAALHTIHRERDNPGCGVNGCSDRDIDSTSRRNGGAQYVSAAFPGEWDWIITPLPQPFWIVEQGINAPP